MRHTTDSHIKPCGCRSVGECTHNFDPEGEAMDALVDDFAKALKAKLRRKRHEGKSGWDDPEWPRIEIIRALACHVPKGDMLDCAAFAAFAWNREE